MVVAVAVGGAVGVAVAVGVPVAVCVAVRVGVGEAVGGGIRLLFQNPPVKLKAPPCMLDAASGWPAVKLISNSPPLEKVCPPPSTVFQLKSKPPPLCATAPEAQNSASSAASCLVWPWFVDVRRQRGSDMNRSSLERPQRKTAIS